MARHASRHASSRCSSSLPAQQARILSLFVPRRPYAIAGNPSEIAKNEEQYASQPPAASRKMTPFCPERGFVPLRFRARNDSHSHMLQSIAGNYSEIVKTNIAINEPFLAANPLVKDIRSSSFSRKKRIPLGDQKTRRSRCSPTPWERRSSRSRSAVGAKRKSSRSSLAGRLGGTEMARPGEYYVLVVRELDRLSRRLAKQLIIEEELKRAGVEIEYVLATYADNPEGNLSKQIKAVISEYERLKINERIMRGRRLKARAGSVITRGHASYGYSLCNRDGKTGYEINPE